MKSLKPQLFGVLCGALPAAFLGFVGAPEKIVVGALFLGIMIGEIIGIAIGNAIHSEGESE